MECATAGFRALRSHVKAVKGEASHDSICSRGIDEVYNCIRLCVNTITKYRYLQDERSESPQSLLELTNLEIGETTQQCNQEHLSEQEQQLNTFRAVVMKEHQNLQERERSIRSMERILEGELERVAEKERNLDMRILEITRLEARLHEALLQQEQQNEPQEVEPVTSNNDLDEREAVLDLREKKLAYAKVQLDEKEKHLKAKERVLNEKAAELSNFQARLQRKDEDRESADAMRIKILEDEQRATHTQQKASLEATRLELEDRCVHLQEREASIAYRERVTTAQAKALEQLQRFLLQQHEWSSMTQEDYLSSVRGLREDQHRPDPQDDQTPKDQPQQLKRKGTLSRFFK